MNKPMRGTKMDESIVIRATAADKAKIQSLAARKGITQSAFVRGILFEAGVLETVVAPF